MRKRRDGIVKALLLQLLPCALVLGACASADRMTGPPLPPEVASAPIVVVGEIHGTNETPNAVGKLVEQLSHERPVALALELPDASAPWIERYLASDGGPAARDDLVSTPQWKRPRESQDGRASLAMLRLIEQMRAIRSKGVQVRVVAFAPSVKVANYERGLADNVLSQMRPGETMVVLVGNVHAAKSTGKMGSFLPGAVTLNARGRAGSYWACAPTCGVFDTEGRSQYDDAALDGRIVMAHTNAFDGVLHIGPMTASPPAAAPN